MHVGLLLRSVHAPWGEGNDHSDARIFRGLLHTSATGEDDQVGQRDFLAASLRGVEVSLNFFQYLEHFLQLFGLIDLPIFLRRKADARAVCTTALVGPTVGGR